MINTVFCMIAAIFYLTQVTSAQPIDIEATTQEADNGDDTAQLKLGLAYLNGEGVDETSKKQPTMSHFLPTRTIQTLNTHWVSSTVTASVYPLTRRKQHAGSEKQQTRTMSVHSTNSVSCTRTETESPLTSKKL